MTRTDRLTHSRLIQALVYEPDTGRFYHRSSGKIAGTYNGEGYRIVSIDGVRYQCARLAWMYVHGFFPQKLIDHVNRIRDDDRIVNLREADRAQNTRNSKVRIDCQSGAKNICYEKNKDLYRVVFTVGGKQKKFGRYRDLEKAKQIAAELRRQIDGEFYGQAV